MLNYGNKIRDMRKMLGLSQAQLAERIGMPQPSVSVWEKSQLPPLEFIIKAHSELTNGSEEIWEFFLEDKKKLDKYMPPDIDPIQIEFLRTLNRIPWNKRELILDGFARILQAVLP